MILLGCLLIGESSVADVDFAAEIVPMFKSRCVVCHLPGSAQAELELHPDGGYSKLVGQKSTQSGLLLVTPGDPEGSYLFRKLEGTHIEAGGTGQRMPFGTQLSEREIELVRHWIEQGAKR